MTGQAWGVSNNGLWDAFGNSGGAYNLAKWHYYQWNGMWGYLWFADLNLYYAHGRWYNPDTGLFLSPDEKGEYFYHGNDAVNYAQTQGPQTGFLREQILDLARTEYALMKIPPFSGGFRTMGMHLAQILTAFESVGEVSTSCPENDDRQCKLAFGAIALVIENRYDRCQGDRLCGFVPGNPPEPTRGQIIMPLCNDATGGCRDFQGLEHWIRIPNTNLCNVKGPRSDCFNLGDTKYVRMFKLAYESAQLVFTDQYKTDAYLNVLDEVIGKRVYFAYPCNQKYNKNLNSQISDAVKCIAPSFTKGIEFWGP